MASEVDLWDNFSCDHALFRITWKACSKTYPLEEFHYTFDETTLSWSSSFNIQQQTWRKMRRDTCTGFKFWTRLHESSRSSRRPTAVISAFLTSYTREKQFIIICYVYPVNWGRCICKTHIIVDILTIHVYFDDFFVISRKVGWVIQICRFSENGRQRRYWSSPQLFWGKPGSLGNFLCLFTTPSAV